jgi:hypothetical protein
MPRPQPEPHSDFVPAFPALQGLKIGTVLIDEDDKWWVFIGWRRNTARHEAVFVQPYWSTESYGLWGPVFTYHASSYDTLTRKFPSIEYDATKEDHPS